ncbi:MAG: outer membrane beta-barrel family protein [Muribaculaceae bacterium]|nr:outer membrane beta-barrel family protein [Muribaculaceae bacterium]
MIPSLSFAGNTKQAVNITPSEELNEAQIDSLERVAYGNIHDLREIVVTADAPMIKVAANQVTYNVDEDPAAAGSTVLDLLRKVPMVSVDGQDNIRVKGNGDFKIYVNGRPEPMLSQNASTILKSMPAEAVASIELITEPGAKYDAEGGGAIINLVTERKQASNGYNGSANISVDNRMLQAGINGAAKFNRLTLNAGVNYAYGFRGQRKAKMEDMTVYLNNPEDHRLQETAINSQNIDFLGIDLGGSYDISPSDLLTFSANYYNVGGIMNITDQTSSMYDADGNLRWSYSRDADMHLKYRGVTAQTAYQHEFGRNDNYLGISYMFNYVKAGLPGNYTYGNLINFNPEYLYEKISNDRITREHTVQIDWSNTINPHAKLEIGSKGIFRRNSAYGLSEGSNDLVLFHPISSTRTSMGQPQDIFALYGLYTATYGPVSAQAGLRYEFTRMGIRFHDNLGENFTSNLNDVVPNASITYSFSPANTLTASYSMRISRPSIEQLNPYKLEISDLRIQQGNPNLTSEKINKVSLTYTNFGRALGGSVSLDYTDTGNAITNYAYLDGYKMVNTFANIGHNRTSSLNIFMMWSPRNTLRLSLNGGLNYTDLKADKDISGQLLSNHGFSGNVTANADWTLPQKFNFGAFGGWGSGSVNLMGKGGSHHYYGLNLSRTFLSDDSLKVTLNAMNCFEKYTIYTNSTVGSDFSSTNKWHNPAWTVGVSVTWHFGKNNANVKSVNSSIVNDDISTAKSAGGASQN